MESKSTSDQTTFDSLICRPDFTKSPNASTNCQNDPTTYVLVRQLLTSPSRTENRRPLHIHSDNSATLDSLPMPSLLQGSDVLPVPNVGTGTAFIHNVKPIAVNELSFACPLLSTVNSIVTGDASVDMSSSLQATYSLRHSQQPSTNAVETKPPNMMKQSQNSFKIPQIGAKLAKAACLSDTHDLQRKSYRNPDGAPVLESCPSAVTVAAGGMSSSKECNSKSEVNNSTSEANIPKASSHMTSVDLLTKYYGRIQSNGAVLLKQKCVNVNSIICCFCKSRLINNVSIVNHMMAHLLYPTDEDEMLENHCRCMKCWRQFESPFTLAQHEEQVHMNTTELKPVCYICESAFDDFATLSAHMSKCHREACDMPYQCQLCKYSSSLYDDVWNHFLTAHRDTQFLLCPFCLRGVNMVILEAKHGRKYGYADDFWDHISNHFHPESTFSCSSCKLLFQTNGDRARHRLHHHHQEDTKEKATSIDWAGVRPKLDVGVTGSDLPSQCFRGANTTVTFGNEQIDCVECRQPFSLDGHFRKRRKCGHCPLRTRCEAYLAFHQQKHLPSDVQYVQSTFQRQNAILAKPRSCKCGFQTVMGNVLAKHIATCSKSDGTAKLLTKSPPSTYDRGPYMPSAMLKGLGLRLRRKYALQEFQYLSRKFATKAKCSSAATKPSLASGATMEKEGGSNKLCETTSNPTSGQESSFTASAYQWDKRSVELSDAIEKAVKEAYRI